MGSAAFLLLATPIFGLSLAIDPSMLALGGATLHPLSASAVAEVASEASTEAEAAPPSLADQQRMRSQRANVHRWMGISTFGVMTATVAAGVVSYRNLYGGGSLAETPCVTGDAWPSQEQCTGTPYGHLTLGLLTAGLYFTTFGLSYGMPDPYGAATGDSHGARVLRTHKALRWVHFGGMVAQILLGMVISNGDWFGLNRADDYDTLKALSSVHLAIGGMTWAALGASGALMVF